MTTNIIYYTISVILFLLFVLVGNYNLYYYYWESEYFYEVHYNYTHRNTYVGTLLRCWTICDVVIRLD